MTGFLVVGLFLISLMFNLVIFSLWLRLAIEFFNISAKNEFANIIYQVTNPVIMPINKVLAKNKTFEWVTLLLIVAVTFVKIILISLIFIKFMMPASLLFAYVVSDLIKQPCDLLFYMVLIDVAIHWLRPGMQNPALIIIRNITYPCYEKVRYIVPKISGFDLAPFVLLIILKIITLFINFSLPWHIL